MTRDMIIPTRSSGWIISFTIGMVYTADQGLKLLAFTVTTGSWWATPRLNEHSGWEVFSLPVPLMISLMITVGLGSTWLGLQMVRTKRLSPWALGLILGGALGNIFDRIFIGAVRDFLHIPSYGLYNAADIAIIAGSVWWVCQATLTRRHVRS